MRMLVPLNWLSFSFCSDPGAPLASGTNLNSLVTLAFDLLTFELVWNVSRGTNKLSANFYASATFLCPVMNKHESNWRHIFYDILTFDVTVHVVNAGHCTLSVYERNGGVIFGMMRYFINWLTFTLHLPNLKFVGLIFGRYGAFSVSAKKVSIDRHI